MPILTTPEPIDLTRIGLFSGLTTADTEELLRHFDELDCAADQVVIQTGDFAPALYIVVTGAVEVSLAVPGGEDALVAAIEPEGVFGETSFFHPAPHSATVRCTKPTKLLRLARVAFDRLLTEDSLPAYRLGAKAAELLATRLQVTDRWLAELLLEERGAITASWRRVPHGFIHA